MATGVRAERWEDAIRQAGRLLVKAGDIREDYIDRMIQTVYEYGPYIVLAPGFALAHAAPCAGVFRDAVSLVNLKGSVEFGSKNDPVSVVLCLACRDGTSHIEMMQKVASVLMRGDTIAKLAGCQSIEQMYQLVNRSTGESDEEVEGGCAK